MTFKRCRLKSSLASGLAVFKGYSGAAQFGSFWKVRTGKLSIIRQLHCKIRKTSFKHDLVQKSFTNALFEPEAFCGLCYGHSVTVYHSLTIPTFHKHVGQVSSSTHLRVKIKIHSNTVKFKHQNHFLIVNVHTFSSDWHVFVFFFLQQIGHICN